MGLNELTLPAHELRLHFVLRRREELKEQGHVVVMRFPTFSDARGLHPNLIVSVGGARGHCTEWPARHSFALHALQSAPSSEVGLRPLCPVGGRYLLLPLPTHKPP